MAGSHNAPPLASLPIATSKAYELSEESVTPEWGGIGSSAAEGFTAHKEAHDGRNEEVACPCTDLWHRSRRPGRLGWDGLGLERRHEENRAGVRSGREDHPQDSGGFPVTSKLAPRTGH